MKKVTVHTTKPTAYQIPSILVLSGNSNIENCFEPNGGGFFSC